MFERIPCKTFYHLGGLYMRKNYFYLFAVMVLLMFSAATSMADNAIMESLKNQGISTKTMDNASLNAVRGAALISGQPAPSVVWGLKQHHVTYSGFGAIADYRSYVYVGSGYNTNAQIFTYNGNNYLVGGDQWLADLTSTPNTWNAAYAQLAEYHYQILNPTTGLPTTYAFRV